MNDEANPSRSTMASFFFFFSPLLSSRVGAPMALEEWNRVA